MDPATGTGPRPRSAEGTLLRRQRLPARRTVAGGRQRQNGIQSLHAFTPAGDGGAWQELGLMTGDRWYPTCTSLPDGRVLIFSGSTEGGGLG
jgi:hypothetical protein